MSNPTPQPYTPTDSRRSEQPMTPQYAAPGPPPQYGQIPPPLPRQNNRIAITALMLACVALLVGSGAFLTPLAAMLVSGAADSGDGGFTTPSSDEGFKGTAPQVVAGRAYPGALLQGEVSRVERDVGGDVKSLSCPATPEVRAGAVTMCHGVIDGSNWDLRITFDDGLGHFTLDEMP